MVFGVAGIPRPGLLGHIIGTNMDSTFSRSYRRHPGDPRCFDEDSDSTCFQGCRDDELAGEVVGMTLLR